MKCGPVYVTEDEKAKHVTKNVIAQSTASEDKKKKSSKYTVAVGSTFGHGNFSSIRTPNKSTAKRQPFHTFMLGISTTAILQYDNDFSQENVTVYALKIGTI